MSRGIALGLLLAVAVVPTSLVTVAHAADDGFVEEISVSGDPLNLAPGVSAGHTYRVANRSDQPAELHLRVSNAISDDNGCVEPETRAGDVTCGAGGGELLPWLEISVLGPDDLRWTGSMQDLEDGVLVGDFGPSATDEIEIVTGLRLESGNDTMTDRVGYDLEWTMQTDGQTISSADIRLSAAGAGGDRGFFDSVLQSMGNPRTQVVALGLFAFFMLSLVGRPLTRRVRSDG